VVTGPEVVLVYDGRDDRFNPRRGAFISGIFSVSDSLITDPLYLRGQLRLERFVPLGPVVLDLVGDLGAGWSPGISDTLPIEDRFYLGGGSSLRGFAVNSVGPANYIGRPEIGFPDEVGPIVGGTSLRDRSAHWVTTGGDSVLASTVEVRVPFPTLGLSGFDNTALATFMDLGHVGFLDSFVTADSALATETTVADPFFRWSVGAGLRISTPIGPAALDLGFNLDPLPGRDEAWILPHLSLGEL
jgi:outer membrane protein assembly factor BamA